MLTPRFLILFLAVCFFFPTPTHAITVYVSPSAPTDVDSVAIVAAGCPVNGALGEEVSFACVQLDAHTYGVDVVNVGYVCFPSIEECFPFDYRGCEPADGIGQHNLGVLAPGHYVVQVTAISDPWHTVPDIYQVYFDVTGTPTGVHPAPGTDQLAVAPNPFASSANIEFALSKRSHATLEVFDVRGGRVRTLVDESIGAPVYTAQWDGRDASGRRQPSGVYFARLTLDGVAAATRRIVLLR